MAAPVMVTEAKPSASGSAAAASEPNTASRISSTIGKPVTSAFSRSSLARSCMPAQSASWPTVYSSTPPRAPSPTFSSSRRSTARSLAWSWVASTASGTVTTVARPARRLATAAARGDSSAWGSSAAARSMRSTAARTSASLGAGAPGDDHGERVGLGAVELRQSAVDRFRVRAGHGEAAAGQVLGLLHRQRRGGHQQHHPDGDHDPAATLGDRGQPVHRSLHPYRSDSSQMRRCVRCVTRPAGGGPCPWPRPATPRAPTRGPRPSGAPARRRWRRSATRPTRGRP